MGKLRGLMDKMTHKEHQESQAPAVSDEDANSFMHKTSQETGAAAVAAAAKREGGGKAVY
jgi:hypothetical protein